MKFLRFIAQKIQNNEGKKFSSLINKIAIGSIAIGLAVMIIAYSVYLGYIQTVQSKLEDCSGHIILTKISDNTSFENEPINITNSPILKKLDKKNGVKYFQNFAYKPAILKHNEEVLGIILKGIDHTFDTSSFKKNLIEGEFINFKKPTEDTLKKIKDIREVVISDKIAKALRIKVNDKIRLYFVQEPPKFRKLLVKGIYKTGIEEFDKQIIYGDLNLIRKFNKWNRNQIGGTEIFLDDFNELSYREKWVQEEMDYDMNFHSIVDKYKNFFHWFKMLEGTTSNFLIVIMIVVAVNIISVLLIMIIERVKMIGSLKAFGATNLQIIKIFYILGSKIIVKGIIIGNLFSVSLILLQQYLRIIPLDEENYYVDAVPVLLDWSTVLIMNIICIVLIFIVMLLPIFSIMKIKAIKAIKFD